MLFELCVFGLASCLSVGASVATAGVAFRLGMELEAKKKPKVKEIHECSMHGHHYEPAYDEQGSEAKPSALPTAGPFMDAKHIVSIAQAQAQAAAAAPKKSTYIHSVCRYCGLTVDRPPGK